MLEKTKKVKKETIDITLINIDSEIYPRAQVDAELIETYRLNMEAGVKFDPLVVQKNTYTLIDGLHRLEALKKLGIKQVEVEVLDIPDSELRAEAIRRNIKYGKRLTSREIVRSIIALRFKDKKTLKQIADIVGLSEGRISQICDEFTRIPGYDLLEFSDFNSKDAKIDLRVKADAGKKEKILKDLDAGLSGKEIAEKYDVSQPTISQIKREHEEWISSPVCIEVERNRADRMFRVAFANKLLKKARLEFKENGVLIRNSDGKKLPIVVAVFLDRYFKEYRVNEPIDGYVESDILSQFEDLELPFKIALIDTKKWKIRYEGGEKTRMYEKLDWRDFPLPNLELDKDGVPTTCHVKVKVPHACNQLPRDEKGDLTLRLEEGELTCSFKCRYDWDCQKSLVILPLGEKTNAKAVVDIPMLDEVLKILSGNVWLGMWRDRLDLAIGQNTGERKVCFIIGSRE